MPEQQMTVEQAMELAWQHHQAGQLQQAAAIYQRVIAQNPNHADALHLIGLIAIQMDQPRAALDPLRRMLALRPNFVDGRYNYGIALRRAGMLKDAIAEFRQCINLQPNYVNAWNNLGDTIRSTGQNDMAIAVFRQGLSNNPVAPYILYNLSLALWERGDLDEAIAAQKQCLLQQPQFPDALYNLGKMFQERGQYDEAIAALREAIAQRPQFPQAYCNLGTALRAAGDFGGAIKAMRQATQMDPTWALPHYNLGVLMLLHGDFEHGWTEYEWRWRVPELKFTPPTFPQPLWTGEPIADKTILLHTEQGFGDAIQFVRYIPLVAQLGAKIVLLCPQPLKRSFAQIEGIEKIIVENESPPTFDLHCPLLNLPLVFKTDRQTIPAEIPYLKADSALSNSWRKRLEGTVRKIGIAWAGKADHRDDRRRSLSPEMLAPLGQIVDVTFISLQKASAAKPPFPIADYTKDLHDFADTAALIDNLDLVITVDTAVAHLAGAMGKPVWLLLSYVPDWRWMLGRHDSPWYPSVRLIRQPTLGDWDTPIAAIAEKLKSWSP